jgi:hypothetical protein
VEGPRRKGVVDGESESGDGEGNEAGNEQPRRPPNKLIYVAKQTQTSCTRFVFRVKVLSAADATATVTAVCAAWLPCLEAFSASRFRVETYLPFSW